MFNKLFLPYDVYERHRKVAEFIEKGETVLDVGGELNRLSLFIKPAKIVVANVAKSREASNVTIKKDKLPYKNNSFSTVCAIDVLEHLPKNKRGAFLKELLRVSNKKVILSFPIGTESHKSYESKTKDLLKSKNIDVGYLNEHIKYGLPTAEEIKNITSGQDSQIEFSGNLTINKLLFRLFLFDPQIKLIRRLTYFSKKIFYFLSNPLFYAFLSTKNYNQQVIRAYLAIHKNR